MTKPRATQPNPARERSAERDKRRKRAAVVGAARKAERSRGTERIERERVRWGGPSKSDERKRAKQAERAERIARGERVHAEAVNIVRRSQRPPNWGLTALRSASAGPRTEPSLPDGSAPARPTTAAQVLSNLYRDGSPRSASASRPATFFSEENLALAEVWARRFVEDAERRRNGQRPVYPNLDEWRGKPENVLHVSGKKLGETSLTDLALGTLAAYRAAEIMAEAEAEIAA